MQRVYGTAFFSDKELKAHLTQIEEAKKRDHRKLGRELGLFMFHPWAPGAAFWLDKGTTLYNLARELHARRAVPGRLRRGEDAAGVQQGAVGNLGALVALPPEHVPRRVSDGEQMAHEGDELPRATCWSSAARCAATATCRCACTSRRRCIATRRRACCPGLTRVRQFSQDDAHCFVMQEQIGEEVERLLGLVQRVYGDFGLTYQAKLSTRPAEFLGEIATWDSAEAQLQGGARARRAGVHDQRGRRRVLRAEDRLRRHRRDRPQVAVRDDPARLPDAGSGST